MLPRMYDVIRNKYYVINLMLRMIDLLLIELQNDEGVAREHKSSCGRRGGVM